MRTGYDLSSEAVQRQVLRQIESTTAQLIICSPPCTKFSRLQALNLYLNDDAWRIEFEKERLKAIKHIDFCLMLCKVQQRRGRYFLFEHPAYADSWQLPQMVQFAESPGVSTVIGDMCMYGLVTPNGDRTGFLPAKKPTQFMSNSWYVLKELGSGATRAMSTSISWEVVHAKRPSMHLDCAMPSLGAWHARRLMTRLGKFAQARFPECS